MVNRTRPIDESVSIWLSVAFAIFHVGYFLVVPWWNPNYTPVRGWVWAVPACLYLVWLVVQVACLFASAVRRTELGARDVAVSYLTSLVMVVLVCAWVFGKLNATDFMAYVLIVGFFTAACETLLTQIGRMIFAQRTMNLS
jgi:hypothetical protein